MEHHMNNKDMSNKKNKKSESNLEPFDKYDYYLRSVQSPENDAEFFRDVYRKIIGEEPRVFCEDFCGTHKVCCEWVRLGENLQAVGVDLDPEPVDYGIKNYQSHLSEDQRQRVDIKLCSVSGNDLPRADIIAAMNFSYFLFKERSRLLEYFKKVYARVHENGLFILDAFGGAACTVPNVEKTKHDGFNYYWDQNSYDPLTNHALFYIHFKRKGEPKREKVFVYDWRLWSLPELKDILLEAGFRNIRFYWEDNDEDGEGNGNFLEVTAVDEEVEAWVAYLVAEK